MHLTGEATLRSIKLVTFLFMFHSPSLLNDSFVLYNSLKDVPLLFIRRYFGKFTTVSFQKIAMPYGTGGVHL